MKIINTLSKFLTSILFIFLISNSSKAQISGFIGPSFAYYPDMDHYFGFHLGVNKADWAWNDEDNSQFFFSWNHYFGRVLPIENTMRLRAYDQSRPDIFVPYTEKLSFNDFQIGYKRYLWSEVDDNFGFYLHISMGFSTLKDELVLGDYNTLLYDKNTAELKPGTTRLTGVPVEGGFGIHTKVGNGFCYYEPRFSWPIEGEYSTLLGSQSTYLPPHLSFMFGYRFHIMD